MSRVHVPGGVRKRDGRVVPFDATRIRDAVERAAFEVLRDAKRAGQIAAETTRGVVDATARESPASRTFRTSSRRS